LYKGHAITKTNLVTCRTLHSASLTRSNTRTQHAHTPIAMTEQIDLQMSTNNLKFKVHVNYTTSGRREALPRWLTCSVYCTRGQSNGTRWNASGSLGMLSISIRFEHCSACTNIQ